MLISADLISLNLKFKIITVIIKVMNNKII